MLVGGVGAGLRRKGRDGVPVVEHHAGDGVAPVQGSVGAGGEHQGGAGVGEHGGDAPGGVGGVDGQVGPPGLQHPQDRHHQLE